MRYTPAPSAYAAFDFCQMAALVQVSKLNDLDGMLHKAEELDPKVLTPAEVAAGGLGAAALFDRAGLRHQQQAKVVALLDREQEVKSFFETHRIRLGAKIIDQHMERLSVAVAFRKREGANLAGTLKG